MRDGKWGEMKRYNGTELIFIVPHGICFFFIPTD
jgi:hypothetical protein